MVSTIWILSAVFPNATSWRTGTVISIHPDNDLKFTEPIRRRLTQRDTGLRSTADGSLLVHGLLDLGSCEYRCIGFVY